MIAAIVEQGQDVGMLKGRQLAGLVVKALQAVGPNLTRASLKAALDNMDFDSGLTTSPLKWRAGNHFANFHMSAYSMQFKNGFNGWRDERTSLDDPWVGQEESKGASCE